VDDLKPILIQEGSVVAANHRAMRGTCTESSYLHNPRATQ